MRQKDYKFVYWLTRQVEAVECDVPVDQFLRSNLLNEG